MRYSPEQRSEALELAQRIGIKPAARQLGIGNQSLHRWLSPDAAERSRIASNAAKDRRRVPCIRQCGRHVGYENTTGVCDRCRKDENLAPCGTRSCYNRGCRCQACKAANAAGKRAWYRAVETHCVDCGAQIIRLATRCRSCQGRRVGRRQR